MVLIVGSGREREVGVQGNDIVRGMRRLDERGELLTVLDIVNDLLQLRPELRIERGQWMEGRGLQAKISSWTI